MPLAPKRPSVRVIMMINALRPRLLLLLLLLLVLLPPPHPRHHQVAARSRSYQAGISFSVVSAAATAEPTVASSHMNHCIVGAARLDSASASSCP
jgi:hypothetical protein